jgi:hypothetical protein
MLGAGSFGKGLGDKGERRNQAGGPIFSRDAECERKPDSLVSGVMLKLQK